jgi:hypothetical protein
LSKKILNIQLSKDYIFAKMSLDNYDNLIDLREYVHNVRGSLELVI